MVIATLLASTLQNSVNATPSVVGSVKAALESNIKSQIVPQPEQITITPSSQQMQTRQAQHMSHSSHSSHSSHRSHYSGYAG